MLDVATTETESAAIRAEVRGDHWIIHTSPFATATVYRWYQ